MFLHYTGFAESMVRSRFDTSRAASHTIRDGQTCTWNGGGCDGQAHCGGYDRHGRRGNYKASDKPDGFGRIGQDADRCRLDGSKPEGF